MKLLLMLCFLWSGTASAVMDVWSEGLHLYTGGGVNTSFYRASGDTVGAGLHFTTNFGYSFKKMWAIEAGSSVKFTKVHDTLIWDTLLSVGVRRRLMDKYYVRVFGGQAPTVFYNEDNPEVYRRSKTSRVIYTGPAFGASFGKVYENWFWETTLSYQSLDKARGVRDEGSVSEEVFRTDKRSVKITSLSVTFGIQVF